MDDEWPEYYDGEDGTIIGREARLYQTWTIAGYLVANYLIQNPNHLQLITFDEDSQEAHAKMTAEIQHQYEPI